MAKETLLNVVEVERTNRFYRNYRLALYEAKLAKIQSDLYEFLQELKCMDGFIRNFFSDMKMYGQKEFNEDELECIDAYLKEYHKINQEMADFEDKIRIRGIQKYEK